MLNYSFKVNIFFVSARSFSLRSRGLLKNIFGQYNLISCLKSFLSRPNCASGARRPFRSLRSLKQTNLWTSNVNFRCAQEDYLKIFLASTT